MGFVWNGVSDDGWLHSWYSFKALLCASLIILLLQAENFLRPFTRFYAGKVDGEKIITSRYNFSLQSSQSHPPSISFPVFIHLPSSYCLCFVPAFFSVVHRGSSNRTRARKHLPHPSNEIPRGRVVERWTLYFMIIFFFFSVEFSSRSCIRCATNTTANADATKAQQIEMEN
jgi:hypothetical protein